MAKDMTLNIVMSAAVGGALSGLLKVQGGMKGVEKQSKILTETTKKLNEENKKLSDAQKSLKAFDDARRKLNDINLEYMKSSKELNVLKKSYRDAGESKAEFAKRVKEAETKVEKLNGQKEAQKHVFERARSAIESEGHSLKTYSDKLVKVEKQLKKNIEAKEKLDKAQAKYSKMAETGKNISNNSAKVLGGIAIPIKVYMDVEESQADLRKILGKEAELYYDKLAEISKNSPLSQVDLNEIAGALSQGGIRGNEIVKYTDMAQKMKVAFDMSTQEAGEFLAKTREQLNLIGKEGTEQLFSYMDTINMLSNKYPVHAADLADISLRTAGYAKNIGLAKEANLGFATALQSTLKSSEQTSTVLSKLYSELAQGANTKAKASALQFLGINPNSLEKEMAKDAEGTILKVLEKIKNANQADKAGLIGDIFGNNASTQNGIAVLTNNLDGLKQKLNEAKQAVGENDSVTAEYNERIKTISSQLKIAKNNFMLGLADVGASLAPLAKGFLEAITPMLKGLADFIKQHPKVTSVIMSSIGAVAALGFAGGKLFQMYAKFRQVRSFLTFLKETGKITSFFSKIQGIVKAVGLAIKSAFLANPVVFIVVAIVAVIAILVVLYHKCAGFRNFVNAMWKAISTGAIAAWNWIKRAAIATWNGIVAYLKWAGGVWKSIFNGVTAYIKFCINVWKAVFRGIVTVAKAVWNAIKFAAIAVWGAIVAYVRFNIAIIKAIFRGILIVARMVWNGIKVSAANAWNAIKTGIRLVKAVFTGDWNTIKSIALGVWDSIKSGFSGMIDGVKSILNKVVTYFGDKFNEIKTKAQNLPLIGGLFGKNYTGTNYWSGGLTTVAERGAEMIKIPGQPAFLAEHEMLLNLPRGTQILNNSQTRSTLREGVTKLKNKVAGLSGNSSSNIGGDIIHIHINGGNNNSSEIAKEVERILKERDNRKRRVAFG